MTDAADPTPSSSHESERRVMSVVGSGGVQLHVAEFGPASAPPILFVHGWCQCCLTWKHQTNSSLAEQFRLVTFDLRGHGMSSAPLDSSTYANGRILAEDVAAVIDQCGLDAPILVGWSHGSFVVCDYLRHFGDAQLAGVMLLSWAVRIGAGPVSREHIGPGFEDDFEHSISTDLATRIGATIRFVDECFARPLGQEDRDEMIAYNMVVEPRVREAMASHEACDNADVIASLRVPFHAIHGMSDTIVLPSALNLLRTIQPNAEFSEYLDVGHAPFFEQPKRFNLELERFARESFLER